MEKKYERNTGLDVLRVIACFMVVFLHVSSRYFSAVPIDTFNWKVYTFYDACVRSAVPLFVMLSGVFFLAPGEMPLKKLYGKYIIRLAAAYMIWSALYTIYDVLAGEVPFKLRSILHAWIEGPAHLWYIPMLVGLYVISPFLKKITELSSKKLVEYGLILFAGASLIRTITYMPFLPGHTTFVLLSEQLPLSYILRYYSYFLLGWFLINFPVRSNWRKWIYAGGLVSPILCAVTTVLVSMKKGVAAEDLFSNFTLFTFLEAMAVFIISSRYSSFNKKWKHALEFLSSCTLGIYLSHILVLRLLASWIDLASLNALWMVPFVSLVVFFVSLLLTMALRSVKGVRKLV